MNLRKTAGSLTRCGISHDNWEDEDGDGHGWGAGCDCSCANDGGGYGDGGGWTSGDGVGGFGNHIGSGFGYNATEICSFAGYQPIKDVEQLINNIQVNKGEF